MSDVRTTSHIRRAFLDYFKAADHAELPSAPLVPQSDPTLLFVNAGMAPLKAYFTGAAKPPALRAVSSQKCVRAGGKHNDLDNVGYTARHHTFFEMLGNFSFGDYFKEEAIFHAWTLLTRDFGLPKEKLLATVYHTDTEARELWRKISGLPDHRIISIDTDDNFWSMGETGPCGPCSEIFYDHGDKVAGGPPGSADADGDRFIEIWNLVFMQYERFAGGAMTPLPKPCIDTGMGLERLSAVLQGKHDNYDTDLFEGLRAKLHALIPGHLEGPEARPFFKATADHIRAAGFLLADGVMPSNEGRGYVLRRILRRAIRCAYMLGAREPVLCRLAPELAERMGDAYPELRRALPMTVEILRGEEERFSGTLEKGLDLIHKALHHVPAGQSFPGEEAFKLYDTYGFPPDLTADILRASGRTLDEAGFEREMEAQRARARAAWKGSGDAGMQTFWAAARDRDGVTEFTGYRYETCAATVQEVEYDAETKAIRFTLNQTPFYAESGGQEGDRGIVTGENGLHITVNDTQKLFGDLHVHHGVLTAGDVPAAGTVVHAAIDGARRARLRRAHTATHILHAVLRAELGDHLAQKGSCVGEDKLRFDFSHPKAVTPEQLSAVARKVNAAIMRNLPVETRVMPVARALESGALALFGEKYGDEVRVLHIGDEQATESVELCGGTHVTRTGDIGFFLVTSEGAVAAGVRRIEALTGEEAAACAERHAALLDRCARESNVRAEELPAWVADQPVRKRALEQEINRLAKALSGAKAKEETHATASGVTLISALYEGLDAKALRELAVERASKTADTAVLAAAVSEGKISVVCAVSTDAQARFPADAVIKAAAPFIGAKGGGGNKAAAQTGGVTPEGFGEAVLAAAGL